MRRLAGPILLVFLLLLAVLLREEFVGPAHPVAPPPPENAPEEPPPPPASLSGSVGPRAEKEEDGVGEGEDTASDAGSIAPTRLIVSRLLAVDEDGRPLPEAFAIRHLGGWEGPQTRIEADGRGILTIPWSRSLRSDFLVGAPGFATEEPDSLPRNGELGVVVLRPGYPLGGVVVDEAGEPVEGARVALDRPFTRDGEVATAEDGRFRFEGLPAGRYSIEATGAGRVRCFGLLSAGDIEARLVLVQGRTLRGRVVLPDGTPATGARVNGGIRVDPDGRFTLPGLRPGFGSVYAYRGGPPTEWTGRADYIVPDTGEPQEIRVVLDRAPRSHLRVRVLDHDGDPVPDLNVAVMGISSGNNRTDEEGRADLIVSTVPRTRVTVRASANAYQRAGPLRTDVEAVTTLDSDGPLVTIRLPAPVLVTFVAKGPDGEPLPEGTRAFFELGIVEHWRATSEEGPAGTDRASFWVHPHDPVGERWRYVKITAGGFIPYQERFEIPEGGGEVAIRLIRGTVVTGHLIGPPPRPGRTPGVEVRVGRHTRAAWEVGDNGAFRIEGVPPGPAIVYVYADYGVPVGKLDVELTEQPFDLGDLRVEDPLVVRGVVTDRANHPLGGVRIEAIDGEGPRPSYEHQAWTGPAGRFRLRLPPFAEVRLLAEKTGYGSQFAIVPAGGPPDELRIRLPPAGSVLVRGVKTPRSVPSARSWHARFPGEDWTWQPEFGSAPGNAHLMTGLPPGDVVVLVESMGGRAEKTVRVVPGETVEVEIEIP